MNIKQSKEKSLPQKKWALANMEVPEIIKNSAKVWAETLTGIVKSEPKDILVSLGYIAQRLIADQHLNSVLVEWEKIREKGRMKEDYAQCMQAKYTLLELLKFLESDMPDEQRFQILKRIMLVAATEEKSDRQSIKPQEFMKLIKILPAGSVMVLTTAYQLSKNPPIGPGENNRVNADSWVKIIAEKSGLEYPALVVMYEKPLIESMLLTERVYADGSGVRLSPHFRVSDLGFELCSFLDHYDSLDL